MKVYDINPAAFLFYGIESAPVSCTN